MSQEILKHTFDNGVMLLGEQIAGRKSAALQVLVGSGSSDEPETTLGIANILCEMLDKGAAGMDARALSEAFETKGIHRGSSSTTEITNFSAAMLSEHLATAIELFAAMLLRADLPESELASVIDIAGQELAAMEDRPSSKVMAELKKQFWPSPFNRISLGSNEGLSAISAEVLKQHYQTRFLGAPILIGVAGEFDWDEVKAKVEDSFASWQVQRKARTIEQFEQKTKSVHLDKNSSQVQIALAYPSVDGNHPDYFIAKVANAVLSGGMAGRLFIEVREKRGLVYNVSSSHSAARERAGVFASASTTPENADETLKVMLEQLTGVAEGLSEDELARAKADLKSKLIMSSESTGARVSALVNEWWSLGYCRKIEDVRKAIDAVSIADLIRFSKENPPQDITLISLGEKAVQL